jgi:hypothetical protein
VSAEHTPKLIEGTTPPKFLVRKYSPEDIPEMNRQIAEEAKRINEYIAELEKSQIVTQETMNLEFTV